MLSRDLEVRALRLESMKLVAQAENVLDDLRTHQGNLERFLSALREVGAADEDSAAKEEGRP